MDFNHTARRGEKPALNVSYCREFAIGYVLIPCAQTPLQSSPMKHQLP